MSISSDFLYGEVESGDAQGPTNSDSGDEKKIPDPDPYPYL